MIKRIRYIICEGENAKTEKYFLRGYQKDTSFIKKVNVDNRKTINYLNLDKNKLHFEFDNISYNKLESTLDV